MSEDSLTPGQIRAQRWWDSRGGRRKHDPPPGTEVVIITALLVMVLLNVGGLLPGLTSHNTDLQDSLLRFVGVIALNIVLFFTILILIGRFLDRLPDHLFHRVRIAFWGFICLAIIATFAVYKIRDHLAGEAAHAREADAAAEEQRIRQATLAVAEQRKATFEQIDALRAQVAVKWRADVESARAFDKPGVVPPMLGVKQRGSFIDVTNHGKQPACVLLQRVARSAASVERCTVGAPSCTTIAPGATTRLILFQSGNPPGCMQAPLEFRVGTAFAPEPSWWSRPALDDPDEPVSSETLYSALSDYELTSEITRLHGLLDDESRATRWRTELTALR